MPYVVGHRPAFCVWQREQQLRLIHHWTDCTAIDKLRHGRKKIRRYRVPNTFDFLMPLTKFEPARGRH